MEARKADVMKHEERKLAEMSIPKKNLRLYQKLKFMDKMNKKEVVCHDIFKGLSIANHQCTLCLQYPGC